MRVRAPATLLIGVSLLAACSVPLLAQTAEDKLFLDRATEEVQKYSRTFRDLTADETATMAKFDPSGKVVRQRKVRSALVIYRSQKDPRSYIEYRDVEEVDGHTIGRHQQRAVRKFGRWANSKSVADELERISEEGNRYNLSLRTVNITLFQGMALRAACRKDFVIRHVRNEELNGTQTRVYSYSQTAPCPGITYSLELPKFLEKSDKFQRGTLWLDASTAQLVREDRIVYASPAEMPEVEFKLIHCMMDYGASDFGILTPVSIFTEAFAFGGKVMGREAVMLRTNSIAQTYGHFSRFEVEVNQQVTEPAQQ